MTTQPTQNPVPSESPRDLKFNAGKIDEFVTSLALKYKDRFGTEHYTIEGLRQLAQEAIAAFGWIAMDSFQDGATLTLPNQVLRDETTGEYYRWDGVFPKEVPADSTPDSSGGVEKGAWVSVGDASLRSMLASSSGAGMVGFGQETVESGLNRLNQNTAIIFNSISDAQSADLSAYSTVAIRYKYSDVEYRKTGETGTPESGDIIRFYDSTGAQWKIVPRLTGSGNGVTCYTQMFIHDPSYFEYARSIGISTFINYIFSGGSLTNQLAPFMELCKLYNISLCLGVSGLEDQIPTLLPQFSKYFNDDIVTSIYLFDEPDTKPYATLSWQASVIDSVRAITNKPLSAALTVDVNGRKFLDKRIGTIYVSVYRQFKTLAQMKYYLATLIAPMEEGGLREGRCVPVLQCYYQKTGTNLSPSTNDLEEANRFWITRFRNFVSFIFYVPNQPSEFESIENSSRCLGLHMKSLQLRNQVVSPKVIPIDINNCNLFYDSNTDQYNIGPSNRGNWWWKHPSSTVVVEDGTVVGTTPGAFLFIVGDTLVIDLGVPSRPDHFRFDYLDLTGNTVTSTWQLISGMGSESNVFQTMSGNGSSTIVFNAADTESSQKNRYWVIKLTSRSSEGTIRRAAIRRIRASFSR